MDRPRFAADHNLPEPLMDAVAPFLPFDFELIYRIDPRLVEDLEDWQVLLAIHQLGYDGLITFDGSMLELPREMAVVHQTKLTVVAIEQMTHNPIQAVGEVMLIAQRVVRAFDPDQPQVFRIPRRNHPAPVSAWDKLGEIASGQGVAIKEVFDHAKVTADELATPVLG